MQQYTIGYAVLASQLDMPLEPDGAYRSELSFAALAYDKDGGALWGTKTRLDTIPKSQIARIRRDGFRAVQSFRFQSTPRFCG